MKRTIKFLICILIGVGIGWYFGYTRPVAKKQRELLSQNRYIGNHLHEYDSDMADFNKRRAEYFEAAKPYEGSGASIALAALKNLDVGDTEGARSRLVAIIAIYYRNHSRDGDTNLLTSIVDFAVTDTVLSNAIHHNFP